MSYSTITLFLAASFVVCAIPGPGVIFVATRSVDAGFFAGLSAAIGLSVGAFLHVVAVALGVSALVASSTTLFLAMKVTGAAYLVYLGFQTLLNQGTPAGATSAKMCRADRSLIDGLVVSILNPTIPLFFLAFIPQFIDSNGGAAAGQIVFLGALYSATALLTDTSYALVASLSSKNLVMTGANAQLLRYVVAALYIGLGITTFVLSHQIATA